MARCCSRWFVANFLFVFNLLFVIIGGAIIFIGIGFLMRIEKYKDVVESKFTIAPICTIFVGGAIIFLAFFGCCGAKQDNKCMLKAYMCLLFGVLILETLIAVLIFVQTRNGDGKQSVREFLVRQFQRYATDGDVRYGFHYMQQRFGCCGPISALDYEATEIAILPKSCCNRTEKVVNCVLRDGAHFTQGCSEVFYQFLVRISNILGGVAVTVATVMTVCILCALWLKETVSNTKSSEASTTKGFNSPEVCN